MSVLEKSLDYSVSHQVRVVGNHRRYFGRHTSALSCIVISLVLIPVLFNLVQRMWLARSLPIRQNIIPVP